MFTPEILEENDDFIKMQINNAIILTINHQAFEADGQVSIDYDEELLTAQEAQELTNSFMSEMISLLENEINKEGN
jgi:hypothetical protein